jgi:hypothetical protein
VEILKQREGDPYPVEKQIAIIYAGVKGLMQPVPITKIKEFEKDYLTVLEANHADTLVALKVGPPYCSWHIFWKEVADIWYVERKWSQYFNKVCQMDKIVEADMAASASATAPAVTTPQRLLMLLLQ